MEQGQEDTKPGFLQAFEGLEDPRSRACPHPLDELLLVALCAITSGAESWVTVTEWGCMKLDWLRRWLPFIRNWVEKKIRRHMQRARGRRGFGWKRWSRRWLYETLGCSMATVSATCTPKASPA